MRGLTSAYLPRFLWLFSYRNSHSLSNLQTSGYKGFRHTEHSLLRENPKWGSRLRETNVGLPILQLHALQSEKTPQPTEFGFSRKSKSGHIFNNPHLLLFILFNVVLVASGR